MNPPSLLVRLRAGIATVLGFILRPFEPLRLRGFRFLYEIWARSRIRGQVAAGVQFMGPIDVPGTGNIHIGEGTRIGRHTVLETQGSGRIDVGEHCTINANVTIVAYDHVTIGDYVLVGEHASIRDANHGIGLGDIPIRRQSHESAPIGIGRDAWIARGVAVLRGTTVGNGAVVGANSVVTRNIPENAIAVGAPATPIGTRKQ